MAQPVGGALLGGTFQIATESSFGSRDATDATSLDISALVFRDVMVHRASWSASFSALKQSSYQPETIGARGGLAPPEVEAPFDALGASAKKVMGEFEVTMPMRFLGGTLPNGSALGNLLSSCMSSRIRTAGLTETATYAAANTYTVTTAATNHLAGDIVAIDSAAGIRRYCRVTHVDTGTNTVTLLTPHGYSADTFTVRHCHQWYPDADGTLSSSSLAVQAFDRGLQAQVIGVGCRVKKISIALAGADKRTPEITFTIRASDGTWVSGGSTGTLGTVLPWGVAGTYGCKWLNSPMTVTQDHQTSTAPYSGTQETVLARDFSATLDIGLSPRGGFGETRTGHGDFECVSHGLTVNLTMDATGLTGFDPREVLRLREDRALTIALNGGAGAGMGMCLHIGRVVVTEDATINMGDDSRNQTPVLQAGQYGGDTATGAVANSPWCIALVA